MAKSIKKDLKDWKNAISKTENINSLKINDKKSVSSGKSETKKLTKTDIKKSAMIQAMEKTLGIVTTACKQVDISRETHYEWMRQDAEYRKRIESIADIALDFAESSLHKQIQNGEVSSTIFYLKTKGKHRGYIEKTETELKIGKLGKALHDELYEDD